VRIYPETIHTDLVNWPFFQIAVLRTHVATPRPIAGSESTISGSTVVPVEAFMVCRSVFEACTSTVDAVWPMVTFKFAVVRVPTYDQPINLCGREARHRCAERISARRNIHKHIATGIISGQRARGFERGVSERDGYSAITPPCGSEPVPTTVPLLVASPRTR
jgi:hypothetical protein